MAGMLMSFVSPYVALAALPTANDFSSVVPYTGLYAYGSNMGYYGQHFKDQDIAQLAYNVGSRTVRPSLPDWLITGYGADARVTAFQFYQQLGMRDLTAFVGEPNDPKERGTSGPDNRETMRFPGADERARTFKGLYEPVWLDSAKTQINPSNTYAAYLYKTVKNYGQYVKFWEIVNEPDFTYGSNGWQDSSQKSSWWNVNPTPDELTNLKAPIYYYVRELRVAWDVIKTLQPNAYVATGGIGYPSFLDALLRNTDNPVDGSVTAEYPLKAGAYFDVLSFHTYPMYGLRHWDNSIMGFVYTRHSDGALDTHLKSKTDFNAVLEKFGYNGTTYPKKQWMVTETDLPQEPVSGECGDAVAARNYIVKAHIAGQANGLMQTYKYGLGESDDNGNPAFNVMGVYGNLSPSTTTIANAPKTEEFKAMKTLSSSLYGTTYDAARTSMLNLPSNVRGAAFKDPNGSYVYALWAVTSIDKSESASVSYTFPFSFSGTRRDWDYSATGAVVSAGQTVTLTGSPSYFLGGAGTTTTVTVPPPAPYVPPYGGQIGPINLAPVVDAGRDTIVTLSTTSAASTLLLGTARDNDGYVNRYAWTQLSGPNTALLFTPNSTSTLAQNLTAGVYYFRFTATDDKGAIAADDVMVTVSGNGRVQVTTNLLNVRATAGGKLVTRVGLGTQGLTIDQKVYNKVIWKKVSFDRGVTGWVSSLYIKNI
jgi:hypothetical protein